MAQGISQRQQEETTEYGVDLLDPVLMQGLQDRFCEANNVYCVCLSKPRGVVTKAYGSKEELDYIHQKAGMNRHVLLLNKLFTTEMEDVIEEPLEDPNFKMCGVSIKMGGKIAALWIVIGVIENDGVEVPGRPDCVKTTTTGQYYRSMEFLAYLSKQFFASKLDEIMAQEAFAKSHESQKKIEGELKRSEVMTSIVQMLESENGFSKITEDILKDVCEYLDISNACLLRLGNGGQTVDMISEWCLEARNSYIAQCQDRPVEDFPFMNGKPYIFSAGTMVPERFRDFCEKFRFKAGITLPVEINRTPAMYLVFFETEKERIWDVGEIKFIKEVKQIIQSILSKRIAKNSLASSYASLEAILENVGCGICVKDHIAGRVLYSNQQFRKMFPDNDMESRLRAQTQESESYMDNSYVEYYAEDENHYYDIYQNPITWVDGRMVTLSTIYDVTDKKIYQQKIERQANNDFLTGLYNRMRCEQDIASCISVTKEHGGQGALLYIDLDDFKHINDGLGHQYGDMLLKAISNSFQRIEGIETQCYRMGGDEFVIIVTHYQYHRLDEIIEDLKGVFLKPWFLKGSEYYCTMSMGVVKFPGDGDDVQELIKKADIALYEAKKRGKNRVEFYDETVETSTFKRLDLEQNMRHATTNECSEFEVYYQPVVDISLDGDPCSGAEALVRWNSTTMGLISPAEFIPMAEYLGLINPIGHFVMQEACKHCKYWNDMGHPEYHVNVNLSVVQLLRNDIVDSIRQVIEETGIDPKNLTLEVTESLAINDIGRMKQILGDIKQLGVKLALDDFGTGYSSLNHIRELPIDIIKIDRCFIIDIGKDDYSEVFVKMVSELAETIGVRICVEGVEELEQVEKLRAMKVQYIQGYYYGKPMRSTEFDEKYLV
ncbi:MAG: EAL domain-containing protein [Roseburia sp.]